MGEKQQLLLKARPVEEAIFYSQGRGRGELHSDIKNNKFKTSKIIFFVIFSPTFFNFKKVHF